jgi:hypothetical protein
MSNLIGAFFVGIVWGICLFAYTTFLDMGSISFLHRHKYLATISDILIVGGGTGVMLYLTDSYFSSFAYGLAGLILASVASTIVWRI